MDLPCTGQPIRLLLTVRKFFCRVASCPRKVFTERLPELLEPFSRLTTRLRTAVQDIGFATCGKGGERLSPKLGIRISDTTLLWSLFLVKIPAVEQVRVVGIDDWSWRRGQRYGSILVNLGTHKIIDLLPERTVESVVDWFEAHPKVEIVSRDRGGTYVDGATQGAPLAIQVCDRWHLLKNLGDAVEDFLVRAKIRLASSRGSRKSSWPNRELTTFVFYHSQALSTNPGASSTKVGDSQQVQELHRQGVSLIKIAAQLGLARNTVRTYVRQPLDPPTPKPRPLRASQLDPYEAHLLKRWREGCRNAASLHREIREMGYPGAQTVVRASIAYLRKHPEQANSDHPRKERAASASPRALRWLLARSPEDLTQEEQAKRTRLLAVSEEVQRVHALLQAFQEMVRQRQPEHLRPWMREATQSGIPELKSFVAGIERDYDAVKAALCLPWSQGITEGKVNKLKTLKRVMYGRAGFPLLRQRLLHDG